MTSELATRVRAALDAITWTPTGLEPDGDGLPYATHTGTLRVGGATVKVHRLNTGERIIDAEDVAVLLGVPIIEAD